MKLRDTWPPQAPGSSVREAQQAASGKQEAKRSMLFVVRVWLSHIQSSTFNHSDRAQAERSRRRQFSTSGQLEGLLPKEGETQEPTSRCVNVPLKFSHCS